MSASKKGSGQMLLSDRDIRARIADGSLFVSYADAPPATYAPQPNIRPASILLHLSNEFQVYGSAGDVQDSRNPVPMEQVVCEPGKPFLLKPYQFALAATREVVQFPDFLAGKVDGRSTLARLGLQVHQTAGHIDPGFRGQITLELFNCSPHGLLLWPGQAVVKMEVHQLSTPAEKPYGHPDVESVYQDQTGPTVASSIQELGVDKHEPPAYPSESLEWDEVSEGYVGRAQADADMAASLADMDRAMNLALESIDAVDHGVSPAIVAERKRIEDARAVMTSAETVEVRTYADELKDLRRRVEDVALQNNATSRPQGFWPAPVTRPSATSSGWVQPGYSSNAPGYTFGPLDDAADRAADEAYVSRPDDGKMYPGESKTFELFELGPVQEDDA